MNAYFYPLTISSLDRIIPCKGKKHCCGLGAEPQPWLGKQSADWTAVLRGWEQTTHKVFWYWISQCFSIKCRQKAHTYCSVTWSVHAKSKATKRSSSTTTIWLFVDIFPFDSFLEFSHVLVLVGANDCRRSRGFCVFML